MMQCGAVARQQQSRVHVSFAAHAWDEMFAFLSSSPFVSYSVLLLSYSLRSALLHWRTMMCWMHPLVIAADVSASFCCLPQRCFHCAPAMWRGCALAQQCCHFCFCFRGLFLLGWVCSVGAVQELSPCYFLPAVSRAVHSRGCDSMQLVFSDTQISSFLCISGSCSRMLLLLRTFSSV